MILSALIQKGGLRRLATGNVATVAVAQSAEREDVAEWWQERAAIMEFDGGLSCDEAERQAWVRTLARFDLPTDFRMH